MKKLKKVASRKMTPEKWRKEVLKMLQKSGGLVDQTKGDLEALGVLAKAGSDEAREHLCLAGLAVVGLLNVLAQSGNARALKGLRGLHSVISEVLESYQSK